MLDVLAGGQPDSNPPVPITWGIWATIERFTAAMEGAKDRTTYPPVAIDIDKVRASGIVKDNLRPESVLKYGVKISGVEDRPGKNREMMGTTLERLAAQLEG